MIDNVEIEAVHSGIVAAIEAITPTYSFQAGPGWVHSQGNRPVEGSGRVRSFWLEWGSPSQVFGGLTGRANTELELSLDVIVSYRMLPAELVQFARVTDAADLHDTIHNRLDGSSPNQIAGLTGVDAGPTTIDGAPELLQFSYSFDIRYMRSRR